MNCYTMKALTPNKEWRSFTLKDLPTLFTATEFALLAKPKSPKLLVNTIRRGDIESGLYEGDVVEADGCKWLICYERGFYAINEDYVIKYLNTLNNPKFLGTNLDIDIGIPISFRSKNLFKYKDVIFRLQDIVGAYNGKMLLRFAKEPVDPDDIQQECCITYNNVRVYLGDVFDGKKIELHGGRITLCDSETMIDITTGGEVNGDNTWNSR